MLARFSTTSFVAGVMVGMLVAGAWFFRGDISLSSDAQALPPTGHTDLSSRASGAVEVADQPAGTSVMIVSVTVPPPGVWIAVRELEGLPGQGETLGSVLGATRVGGPRREVAIDLLRATFPARRYAVELYRDDAGVVFAPGKNSVYVDFDTGAPVIAYFMTQE